MGRLRYTIRKDKFLCDFDVYDGRPCRAKVVGKVVKTNGEYTAIPFDAIANAVSGFGSLRLAIAYLLSTTRSSCPVSE